MGVVRRVCWVKIAGRNMLERTGLWVCCLMTLIFLVACGDKKEKADHKEETKHGETDPKQDKGKEKKAEHKEEAKHGEGDSKNDLGLDAISPSIVAHLRIELNRESSEDKILPIAESAETMPKVAAKEKVEAREVPPPALTARDTGYKTDKEYLALQRFELPPQKEEKKSEKKTGGKEELDTIRLREKILILGGKGSDIQGFKSKAKDSMNIDENSRLADPLPEEPPKKEHVKLDLKEDNIKNKRSLIFHQQGAGFFKTEEPDKKDVISKAAPLKTSPTLERVPETKLLFSQGKDNQISLQPKEGKLDLLLGNEGFNRRSYDSEQKPIK